MMDDTNNTIVACEINLGKTPKMPAKKPSNSLQHSNVLVVGCGYLGARVARRAQQLGAKVHATTRCTVKAQSLAAENLHPLVLDWNDRRTLKSLDRFDRILIAVSYDPQGPHDRFESQVGGLGNLLAVVSDHADVCYISTTGVYHQTDGRWVDESSPSKPTSPGGRAHQAAETLLRRHRPNGPGTILRLSGIYGPGRIPRASDVIAGRPIRANQDGYLNLIHVDDAATVVLATWQHECDRMFVVSDDHPVIRGDFYREIARRHHVDPPVFQSPDPQSSVAIRSTSNKRVWNRKMKTQLVNKLQFPTYREGLSNLQGNR